MDQGPAQVTIVVVGDGSVGKTCVLLSYTTDKFPVEYVPTVFDNYTSNVNVNGEEVTLNLWDTAGQETYDQLRVLSYGAANVFVIVFSVIENASFENAINKWLTELSAEQYKKVPKIIIGNKIDMRSEQNINHIQRQTAQQIVESRGIKYVECSALTQEGLKDVFDLAIKAGLNYVKNKDKPEEEIQSKEKKPKSSNNTKESCCHLM